MEHFIRALIMTSDDYQVAGSMRLLPDETLAEIGRKHFGVTATFAAEVPEPKPATTVKKTPAKRTPKADIGAATETIKGCLGDEPLSATEIAHETDIEIGVVSKALKSLVKYGWAIQTGNRRGARYAICHTNGSAEVAAP